MGGKRVCVFASSALTPSLRRLGAFCGPPGVRGRQGRVGASRAAFKLCWPPVFPPPHFPPALGEALRVSQRRPWGPRRRGRPSVRPRDWSPPSSPPLPGPPVSPRSGPVTRGSLPPLHPPPPSFSEGSSVGLTPPLAAGCCFGTFVCGGSAPRGGEPSPGREPRPPRCEGWGSGESRGVGKVANLMRGEHVWVAAALLVASNSLFSIDPPLWSRF